MENKVLEKNLAHIAQYDKELSDKILMTEFEKSNLQLLKTNTGEYNLALDGYELHSAGGAEEESYKIANSINYDDNSLVIVYGLGLGYLADSIAKRCENAKIIIYEPNIELVKFVLSIAQIDALYKNNVFLSADKLQYSKLLEKFLTPETTLSISFLNSYNQLFKDDIKETFQLAQDILSEIIGNKNTYLKYAFYSCDITFVNMAKLIKSPMIQDLKDIYKGKTALIMCAGPSLEENIELIKQNKDKFVTFALNPTLKLLKKHDFVPDFIVNVDAVDNSIQFSDIDFLDKVYYISDISTNPKTIYLTYKNHFFFISQNNFFNHWIRECFDIEENLKSLGTSSHTAFQSALLMGFSKIIFTGQDLAYKDEKCYSSGSQYGMLRCVFNNEKQKYEIIASDMNEFKNAYRLDWMNDRQVEEGSIKFLEKLNKNLRTVKGKDGNLVPTKADYLVFIKIFEREAENIKNVELINCSNGADIKGYKNMNLSDVLSELENIEKLDLSAIKHEYHFEKFLLKADILQKNLEEMRILAENTLSTIQKISDELENKKKITANIVELLKLYRDIYKEILVKFEDKDINSLLAFCMYDIKKVMSSNFLTDEKALMDALKNILNYFTIMKQSIGYYSQHLADAKALVL